MPACYDGEERKTESGEEAVIRKMKTDDLEDVLQIWLESNLQAHHFWSGAFCLRQKSWFMKKIKREKSWVFWG